MCIVFSIHDLFIRHIKMMMECMAMAARRTTNKTIRGKKNKKKKAKSYGNLSATFSLIEWTSRHMNVHGRAHPYMGMNIGFLFSAKVFHMNTVYSEKLDGQSFPWDSERGVQIIFVYINVCVCVGLLRRYYFIAWKFLIFLWNHKNHSDNNNNNISVM